MSIGPLGTNFSEILSKIQNFSFTKMHLKISSVKWQPFFLGGDELNMKPCPCHRSCVLGKHILHGHTSLGFLVWFSQRDCIVNRDICSVVLRDIFCSCPQFNRLRLEQYGQCLADDMFKCNFFMEIVEFWFKFHWNLFRRIQLIIFQHWFR